MELLIFAGGLLLIGGPILILVLQFTILGRQKETLELLSRGMTELRRELRESFAGRRSIGLNRSRPRSRPRSPLDRRRHPPTQARRPMARWERKPGGRAFLRPGL